MRAKLVEANFANAGTRNHKLRRSTSEQASKMQAGIVLDLTLPSKGRERER